MTGLLAADDDAFVDAWIRVAATASLPRRTCVRSTSACSNVHVSTHATDAFEAVCREALERVAQEARLRLGVVGHPALSVVIPAYNEAERLATTLRAVQATTADLTTEIIVVDDGSADATSEVATTTLDSSVDRVVRARPRTPGRARPVRAGVLASEGDAVLYMDADLATDLAHAPRRSSRRSGRPTSWSGPPHTPRSRPCATAHVVQRPVMASSVQPGSSALAHEASRPTTHSAGSRPSAVHAGPAAAHAGGAPSTSPSTSSPACWRDALEPVRSSQLPVVWTTVEGSSVPRVTSCGGARRSTSCASQHGGRHAVSLVQCNDRAAAESGRCVSDAPSALDVLASCVAALGGEDRPGQHALPRRRDRRCRRHHLLAEAPTGSGKGLAYLAPRSRRRSVRRSSHRDAHPAGPALAEGPAARAGARRGSRWTGALLKGRSNYLCLAKLDEAATAGRRALRRASAGPEVHARSRAPPPGSPADSDTGDLVDPRRAP